MNDILKEIRDAEKKANKIIEDAEKRKEIIIKNAAEEAKKLELEDVKKYADDLEKKFLKELDVIKKEGDALVEEERKKALRITKKAESNADKAIKLVHEKFKEK
mgnify:CR=1 FL=1